MPGEHGARLSSTMALLALLWVAVYWWWEPDRGGPVIDLAEPATAGSERGLGADEEPLVIEMAPARPEAPVSEPEVAPSDRRIAASDTLAQNGETPDGDASAPGGRSVVAERPADPTPVLPPSFRAYVIRPGDTFESIARRELGSARFAGAIARANAFVDPMRLRVGREIRIPVDPANIQGRPADDEAEPEGSAPMEYVVRRGDTLSAIAARIYGSSAEAGRIFEANRDRLDSPDDVRVGQTLRLPPKPAGG